MQNNNRSNGMNDELLEIIKNFDNSGQVLVKGNRNLIKIFDYNGQSIAIKSFKKPIFINGLIYKYFRDSKAKRSFENSNFLLDHNIGTPKPIAFYENSNFLQIKDSYYICQNLDYDFMFRVIFDNQQSIDLEKLLIAVTDFSFQMHQVGIEFIDHSPGNTLIKIDNNGSYNCYLVDLNRMKFHEKMSLSLRLKNLNKLTRNDYMVRVIAKRYAFNMKISEDLVFVMLWKEVQMFFNRYDKKVMLKNKIMFWKH